MRRREFSCFSLNRFAQAGMAVVIMLMLAGAARADIVDAFSVQGTAQNGGVIQSAECDFFARCPFSGIMFVDATTGLVTGLRITFPFLPTFNIVRNQGNQTFVPPFGWNVIAANNPNDSASDFLNLTFTPTPPSALVAFGGGTIVRAVAGGGPILFDNGSGEITLVGPVEIPEPSSLTLLGTALLCLLVYGVVRRDKMALVQRPAEFSIMS